MKPNSATEPPRAPPRFQVGIIINPIAGMGGRVGLKGTDGSGIFDEALRRGAHPVAAHRAKTTLQRFLGSGFQPVKWFTGPGLMGATLLDALDLPFTLITPKDSSQDALNESGLSRFRRLGETTAQDTVQIARQMSECHLDVILFFGGDGTAANIAEAIDRKTPVIGVPTGVKMFSAVFALTPIVAADLLHQHLADATCLEDRDVLDIDEAAYRQGRLIVTLKGILKIPVLEHLVQASKATTIGDDDEEGNQLGIAKSLVAEWDHNALYLLGPGTTVEAIADLLGLSHTLLGIDVVKKKQVLVHDANEDQLLQQIKAHHGDVILVLSPIGRQGFLLGRGNQQLSPAVLSHIPKKNIRVVATRQKMQGIKVLYVDTGDPRLDAQLHGYIRVLVDYREERLVPVA